MASVEIVLKELLPGNETKVYLAMLGLGSASATEITERSGIHRANVYDCLESMHQKGLITVIVRKGKKFFEAVSPERLKAILEEKKERIESTEKKLEEILPELNDRFGHRKSRQLIHHLVGIEGLKTVAEEMLKEGAKAGELYTINSTGGFRKFLPLYFEKWIQARTKKKINLKMLSPESRRGTTKIPLCEVKYLPDDLYSPMTVEIFGDKAALFLYEEQPVVILLESKPIAEAFKKQFHILWKMAKP